MEQEINKKKGNIIMILCAIGMVVMTIYIGLKLPGLEKIPLALLILFTCMGVTASERTRDD